MRSFVRCLWIVGLAGCTSAPRGPSEAEVREQVDRGFQQSFAAIQSGDIEAFLAHVESKGTMVLRNVRGPNGVAMNVDLVGADSIRAFVNRVGVPPGFVMRPTGFRRNGDEAVQTGDWEIGPGQTGAFSVTWRRDASNRWKIATWRLDGQ